MKYRFVLTVRYDSNGYRSALYAVAQRNYIDFQLNDADSTISFYFNSVTDLALIEREMHEFFFD